MNRVLIVSDSHGLTNELRQIKDRHHALYNIHCGDSELVEDSPFLHEYITVKGNCDWKANFPKINKITINGVRFLITHGHLHHVKTSLLNLTLAAKEADVDVVCFGHSHIPYVEKIDDQIFINPGSIRLPKQYDKSSYVLLEWNSRKNFCVNFYDLSGNILTDLSKKINL